jgi:sortase A
MSRGLALRLGVVLLLAGLGLLGWVGWQYFGTDIRRFPSMVAN